MPEALEMLDEYRAEIATFKKLHGVLNAQIQLSITREHKLEQENAKLRAALAAIADQFVQDKDGLKLQAMACDALKKVSEL